MFKFEIVCLRGCISVAATNDTSACDDNLFSSVLETFGPVMVTVYV